MWFRGVRGSWVAALTLLFSVLGTSGFKPPSTLASNFAAFILLAAIDAEGFLSIANW